VPVLGAADADGVVVSDAEQATTPPMSAAAMAEAVAVRPMRLRITELPFLVFTCR